MLFANSMMEAKICESRGADGKDSADGEQLGASRANRLRASCITLREGLAQMLLARAVCARQKRFEVEQ